MTTNKRHVKNDFLDWYEGNLNEAREVQVNRHLNECESCQTYYHVMKSTMEDPKKDQLPFLEMDPYLPVRVKQQASGQTRQEPGTVFGLSKAMTGMIAFIALLIGFFGGQLLVFHAQQVQQDTEQTSISELYYEGMVQPDLGLNLEQAIEEMEGDPQ